MRLSGVVDVTNCTEIYDRLLEVNPDHLARDVFYDLAEVTDIDLTFDQMNALVGLRRQYYAQSVNARIGIWAPDDMTFGMSRMYVSLLDQFDAVCSGVFRCQREVAAYLDVSIEDLFGARVAPDRMPSAAPATAPSRQPGGPSLA
ncbi:MAG: hypothetical protein EP318_17145 [Rhodobacteraceae bacterium]|nr:MAG: hypothetical protein EP318_17145 [Paracoccaceae bacterium]